MHDNTSAPLRHPLHPALHTNPHSKHVHKASAPHDEYAVLSSLCTLLRASATRGALFPRLLLHLLSGPLLARHLHLHRYLHVRQRQSVGMVVHAVSTGRAVVAAAAAEAEAASEHATSMHATSMLQTTHTHTAHRVCSVCTSGTAPSSLAQEGSGGQLVLELGSAPHQRRGGPAGWRFFSALKDLHAVQNAMNAEKRRREKLNLRRLVLVFWLLTR